MVALIAEAHWDDSTRVKVNALLPKNGSLAHAVVWPDQIRKALPQFNPVHYVDVPRGATAAQCAMRIENPRIIDVRRCALGLELSAECLPGRHYPKVQYTGTPVL